MLILVEQGYGTSSTGYARIGTLWYAVGISALTLWLLGLFDSMTLADAILEIAKLLPGVANVLVSEREKAKERNAAHPQFE